MFKLIYLLLILVPLALSVYVEKAPKYIYDIKDFESIKDNPNGTYILKDDLDFSNEKISNKFFNSCTTTFGGGTPTFSGFGSESTFSGVFDGNGHTIKNVSEELFFCTTKDAVIKDLNIIDVNLQGRYAEYTAVIANENYGLIENVHIKGDVNGFDRTGGLVGVNRGEIKYSSFSGNIEGIINVGGLSGSNYGHLSYSYTIVDIKGKSEVGGLVGSNHGYGNKIQTSLFSAGSVKGEGLVGGLFGSNQAQIDNAYSNSLVTGEFDVGGLIGRSSMDVTHAFALGDTVGENRVGGLFSSLHEDYGVLKYSFAYGNVAGTENVSGLTHIIHNEYSYQYEGQKINDEVVSGDDLNIVTKNQLLDKNWYIETVHFDEDVWDFEPLDRGYFPKLKELANQADIEIK